jgi:predicted DCC family thiol-disulfide oxidoreductase YuxK
MLRFERPVAVYDGDCGFCERSVTMLAALAPDVALVPSASLSQACRDELGLDSAQLANALHVVPAAGAVLAGADAVNFFLLRNRWLRALVGAACRVPFLIRAERAAYAFIARHRASISRLFFARSCSVDRAHTTALHFTERKVRS